ncbi:MAG: hypothetical protein AAF799_33705 [Myxococcota bacterium]
MMRARAGKAWLVAGTLAMGTVPGVVRAEPVSAVPEAPGDSASPRGTGTTVVVLPVRLSGELPPGTDAEVRGLLETNLAQEGLELTDADAGVAAECDAACRSATAGRLSAAFLVQADVVGSEDEYSVTVTLFDGTTGQPLAPFEAECSICGFVEVRDMVRLRAMDARAEIVRRAREMETTTEVKPPPPVTDEPRPRSPLLSAGWALVGAGAGATLGGVVLMSMHKQSAGCATNPRGGECVPLRYTTLPAGAALLGAGVAVTVAGVIMVLRGRRKSARPPSQARVRSHGAGLALRF